MPAGRKGRSRKLPPPRGASEAKDRPDAADTLPVAPIAKVPSLDDGPTPRVKLVALRGTLTAAELADRCVLATTGASERPLTPQVP